MEYYPQSAWYPNEGCACQKTGWVCAACNGQGWVSNGKEAKPCPACREIAWDKIKQENGKVVDAMRVVCQGWVAGFLKACEL